MTKKIRVAVTIEFPVADDFDREDCMIADKIITEGLKIKRLRGVVVKSVGYMEIKDDLPVQQVSDKVQIK